MYAMESVKGELKRLKDFQLSDDTKKYLTREFRRHDKNGSGFINHREFEECLTCVGIEVEKSDIYYLQKHFDSNGDGKLSVKELVDNISVIHAHALKRDELMEAFAVFDVEKKGFIRLPHMLKILTVNNFMTPKEASGFLEHLTRKYDKNFDGKFEYSEFVQMFMCESEFKKFGDHMANTST